MPKQASEVLTTQAHLKLLAIGPVRVGKTTAILGSCPKPAYVLQSDDEQRLKPAARVTSDFTYDMVNASDGSTLLGQFERALAHAGKGAKDGSIKTVVHDTLSSFADYLLEAELLASKTSDGNEDGRKAYDHIKRRMRNLVARLIALPCHVIVVAHDFPVSGELPGQLKKRGNGILANIPGGFRNEIAKYFDEIVYVSKGESGETREFHCSIPGVYGPGSTNLPGVEKIPADVTGMIELIAKGQIPGRATKPTALAKPGVAKAVPGPVKR